MCPLVPLAVCLLVPPVVCPPVWLVVCPLAQLLVLVGQVCPQLWPPYGAVVAPTRECLLLCLSPRRVAHECGVSLTRLRQLCGCL